MADELDPVQATRLLERMRAGDPAAAQELLPLLYTELKAVAAVCMGRQQAGHTLQATALVHEVWLRIARAQETPNFENRAHFLRMAARTMRHVLVDHARSKRAQKRGAGEERLPLDGLLASFEESQIDLLDLNQALEALLELDIELARIVELRFFAGLTSEEVALALGISERTVHRGWKVARLWLRERLERSEERDPRAANSG